MVTVPAVCPDTPHLESDPVILYVSDDFRKPMPFTADVQAKIRSKLKLDIQSREKERIIRQLANRTVIEVDPEVLK